MRPILPVVILAAALAAGCGKDEPSKDLSNTTTATNNVSSNNMSTNTTSTGSNNTISANNAATNNNNTTAATNNNSTAAPMCAGTTECFANTECATDQRCQDVGNGVEMPCCVVGARGSKMTGAECVSENECASGVCIGRNQDPEICSEDCGATMDCGDALECVQIPFTGGSGMWCVTPG